MGVDANAALSIELALKYAGAISNYGLAWFEEPIDPLDFEARVDVGKLLFLNGEKAKGLREFSTAYDISRKSRSIIVNFTDYLRNKNKKNDVKILDDFLKSRRK